MRATWRALSLPLLALLTTAILFSFTLAQPLAAQQTRDTTTARGTGTTTGGTASPNSICQPGDPSCGGGDTYPPSISFTPSGGTFTSTALTVQVLFEDNESLYGGPSIYFNNATVSNYTLSSCGTACETATFGVTLQPGTNTVRASIRDNAGNMGSGSATYTYNPPPPSSLTVVPKGGSVTVVPNSNPTKTFTISSTGGASSGAKYNLSASCTPTTSPCSVSPTSVTIAASGDSAGATVTYHIGGDGATEHVQLTATYAYNSAYHDAGYIDATAQAPCTTAYSGIVPCNGGTVATLTTDSVGAHLDFTLTNNGAVDDHYTFSCSATAPLTNCQAPTTVVTLHAKQQTTVTATFDAGASEGVGTVRLLATGENDEVGGSAQEAVLSPTSVVVTTDGSRMRVESGAGASHAFVIKNAGSLDATYRLEPLDCATAAVDCVMSDTLASIRSGATDTVTVSFTGGTPGLSGSVGLRATNVANAGITASASAPVTVNAYGVAVTPEDDSVTVTSGSPQSYTFTVTNTGNTTTTYTLSTPCISPVTSCVPSAGSIQIDSGVTQSVSVTYTASTASLSGGVIRLRAAYGSTAPIADTGVVRVSAHTAAVGGEPQVALINSDSLAARDLCLTIAAGSDAAYECGALRIVHALPSIRTMNKARTPVLLYNSGFAEPHPLIAANVTLLADTVAPPTIQAVLNIDGNPSGITVQWSGSGWVPGTTRRLVIPVDDATLATGLHTYQLQVINVYPTVQRKSPAVTGRFVVVNRAASPFGAGWWLAGLEQLVFSTADTTARLWVGGDGSVRLYEKVNGTTWAAPAVDRPDTLTWDAASATYTRHLPHGVRVLFDNAGHHVQTIDRLDHQTTFTYDQTTGWLKTIAVPPNRAGQTYTFAYDTVSHQVTITAPPMGSTARVTTLLLTNGQVTTIRDPDYQLATHPYIAFGYDSASARIDSLKDKRGTTTSYTYDDGHLLRTASIPLNQTQTATTTFFAAESEGLAPAVVLADAVYTALDGPRTDVPDTTKFWPDRFGTPWKIRDALGYETILSRTDATYPALTTRFQQPNGHVIKATYDARGNLATRTDSAGFGPGDSRSPVTAYQWDPTWDFVTQITQPEGQVTTFSYDPTTGNRLWQQLGPDGAGRRVEFAYYDSGNKLPRSSLAVGDTVRDSVTYDALGNADSVKTPLGYWTRYFKDNLGRDTLVQHPIGTSPTDNIWQDDSIQYDMMDRVTRTVTYGPAVNGAPAQRVVVLNFYDRGGLLDSLKRVSIPDPAGIDTIMTRWRYDSAGRRIAEVAPDGQVDSTTYDLAGNVIMLVPRRNSVTPMQIRMVYDTLNRLVARVTPDVSYPTWTDGIASFTDLPASDSLRQPYGGLTIPGDSASFAYDTLGNLIEADNANAKVSRTYYPNGLLKTETQRIRTVDGTDFSQHIYSLTYEYNANGQRTALHHPSQLIPPGYTRGVSSADYDPVTGDLSRAVDPLGNEFLFTWDNHGWLQSMSLPGGASDLADRYVYDADGNVQQHTAGETTWPAFRNTWLTHSARGQILTMNAGRGALDTLVATYAGLGSLVADTTTWHGSDGFGGTGRVESIEQFGLDALGNKTADTSTTTLDGGGPQTVSEEAWGYAHGTGRLSRGDTPSVGNDTLRYDPAGNTEFTWQVHTQPDMFVTPLRDRASYYDAENRLWASDYRVVTPEATGQSNPDRWKVVEHYRYDALGRRVLVETTRWCGGSSLTQTAECRLGLVRRTIWDGSQELDEIQMPSSQAENDTTPVHVLRNPAPDDQDLNPYFGRVLYTFGVATDEPISVTRVNYADDSADAIGYRVWSPFALVPLWTVRGEADMGLFASNAAQTLCDATETQRCVKVFWRAGWRAYNQPEPTNPAWHGSLVDDKRDKAGTRYRRARVYDPVTGRFTQEDPMGLAGGLNLYGFAAGDPLTYSDPFGLCPKDAGGDGKSDVYSDCPKGSSGYYAYQDAQGNGSLLNTVKGWVAACKESTTCSIVGVAGGAYVGGLAVSELSGLLLGGTEAASADAAELKLTQTVANHAGSRPYVNSQLLAKEIMNAGKAIPDPGGVAGALRWDVPGAFNGSRGIWQLVVDPRTKTILHFLFTSAPK